MEARTNCGPVEIIDALFEFLEPLLVRAMDPRQDHLAFIGGDEEPGDSMVWIVFVARQPVFDEPIRNALHALALETEFASNLGHGGATVRSLQHHPSRVSLPFGCGDPLAGISQKSVDFENRVYRCVGVAHIPPL